MKRKLLHTLAAAAVLVPMTTYAADAPDQLYMVGNVNGGGWAVADAGCVQATRQGDVFTFENVKLTMQSWGGASFVFRATPVSSSDAHPKGTEIYGTDENADKTFQTDTDFTVIKRDGYVNGQDLGKGWVTTDANMCGVAYTITVDFSNDRTVMRAEKYTVAPDPIVPGEMPESLNLIGLVNGGDWSTQGNFVSCTAVDKEAGTITFTNAEITGSFAFCDEVNSTTTADECKNHDGFYGPDGSDKDAVGSGTHNDMYSKSGKGFTLGSVGGAGLYDITVYFPEDARPYFTITRVGNIPKRYYFVGDMNDWYSSEFTETKYEEGGDNPIYIRRPYPGTDQYYYEICQNGKAPSDWDGKYYRISNQADWVPFEANKAKWEFEYVGKLENHEGDNWYVFDRFPNNILTGQFQITDGTPHWGGEVYSVAKGISNVSGTNPSWDDYKAYAACTITREAISGGDELGNDIIKRGNGQNFHMSCNAVYEAKIYLLPGENPKMIVAGEPVDFYLFYGMKPDEAGQAALDSGNAKVRALINPGKPNTNNYYLPGIWYGQYDGNGNRTPLPNNPEDYDHMNLNGRNLVEIDLTKYGDSQQDVADFLEIKDENGNLLFPNYPETRRLVEDIVKNRELPNDMSLEGYDKIWVQKIPNGFCSPAGRKFTLSLVESLNAGDRGTAEDPRVYTITANHMYFFSIDNAHVHVNAETIEKIANVEVSYRVYGQDGLWNTIVLAPENNTVESKVIYDRRSVPKATATEDKSSDAYTYGWVTLNSDYKNCTNWWGCDHKYHEKLDIQNWKYCVKDVQTKGVNALADEIDDRMQIASRYTHKYVQFRFHYSPKTEEGSFQFEPYDIYVPEAPRAVAENAKYNLNGHDYYLNLADDPIYTGIEGIFDDVLPGDEAGAAEEGEPVYYNLQGLRVEKPTNGLFIKVTGKKSEKIYLR